MFNYTVRQALYRYCTHYPLDRITRAHTTCMSVTALAWYKKTVLKLNRLVDLNHTRLIDTNFFFILVREYSKYWSFFFSSL